VPCHGLISGWSNQICFCTFLVVRSSTTSWTTCDTLQHPRQPQRLLTIHCKVLCSLTDLLRYTARSSTSSTKICNTLQRPQQAQRQFATHCNILNDDLRYTATTSRTPCEKLQLLPLVIRAEFIRCR
jgi:hypothetical protein